jgi:hypothetical protein
MSKKFEKLNEVFNVSSEAISTELDTIDKDIQSLAKNKKLKTRIRKVMLKRTMSMLVEIYILLWKKVRKHLMVFSN